MAAFHMSSSIAVPIHSDVIARNQKQNASVPNAPNVAVRRKSQTIGTPEAQALEHVAADAEKLSSSQFACMGKNKGWQTRIQNDVNHLQCWQNKEKE
jgi:hypothetical protein